MFAGCMKSDPHFQQVGAMALASRLGNRDLKEQPGARSSRIRSAKAEGSWILSSSLYDQLVEGNGNAQPLYNVLEHLASKDTAFQHHPTVGQMLGWVAAIITDDKAKFDSFGSFAEKLGRSHGQLMALWFGIRALYKIKCLH